MMNPGHHITHHWESNPRTADLLEYIHKLQKCLRAAGRRTLLYTEQTLHNVYKKSQYHEVEQLVTKLVGIIQLVILGMFCLYAVKRTIFFPNKI